MNVHHLVPSMSRRLLFMGPLMLAAGLQQPVHASGADLSKFGVSSRSTSPPWETPGPPPAMARNHGAFGARTRARAVANSTATVN